MPGLDMDPLQQFQQLLQNMMSPENETRFGTTVLCY